MSNKNIFKSEWVTTVAFYNAFTEDEWSNFIIDMWQMGQKINQGAPTVSSNSVTVTVNMADCVKYFDPEMN